MSKIGFKQNKGFCKFSILFKLVPIKYDFLEIGYGMGFLPTKKIAIIGTPTNDFSINMGEGDMTQTEATLIFFFHTSFAENAV